MAKFVVPGGAQIKLRWFYQQYPALQVFGGGGATITSISQAVANTMDTSIKAAFTSSGLKALMGNNTQLVSVGARYVGDPDYVEYIGNGAAVIGTGTGDSLGRGLAAVCTLRTARAGLSYRGRVFFGGFVESVAQTDGTFDQATETAIESFVTSVKAAISAAGMVPAVLSPALPSRLTAGGETLDPKPAFWTEVISHEVRNRTWGSQRRRNHRL